MFLPLVLCATFQCAVKSCARSCVCCVCPAAGGSPPPALPAEPGVLAACWALAWLALRKAAGRGLPPLPDLNYVLQRGGDAAPGCNWSGGVTCGRARPLLPVVETASMRPRRKRLPSWVPAE